MWPAVRLVLAGHATYTEVDSTMSIDDVQILGIALNFWDELATAERA